MTLVEINPIILKCSQVSGLLFDEWFNNGISLAQSNPTALVFLPIKVRVKYGHRDS
jgi:hypothetical protein